MTVNIRNIAIIAHVDHGKTTLVDAMLRQSGIFRSNEHIIERVMDSNPLEKERGITILAKNTSVMYEETKINIIDTPGHADFGGEVERALSMTDGVLLIVDAFEGPMPQTKFVLKKALALHLKTVVVINKIDRPDARPSDVLDLVLDLFIELGASDDQLSFPVVYASARAGTASLTESEQAADLKPLFDTIINDVPAPKIEDGPLQILVANIDYDSYLGTYAVGKISRGAIKTGETVALIRHNGEIEKARIAKLFTFQGLKKQETTGEEAGDIVAIAGLGVINIGDTISDAEAPEQLPVQAVDEPTLTMNFMVNTSPFAGQEGAHVTSRKIRDRLYRELNYNVSLRVEDTDNADTWKVSGRGELHLSILIENMRREGYELAVSKPEVIYKRENDALLEPMEHLIVDIPEVAMGSIMEKLGNRKAEMLNMVTTQSNIRLEFSMPARGLIGFRSEFLTATRGQGVLNHTFDGYAPYKGDIDTRHQGSMIAWEEGETTTFGLLNTEERGLLFITAGTKVYEGMIVGLNNREQDLDINVCKKKQLTNMRASGSDDTVKLKEPHRMTLEEAIEFISDDELVEITPQTIRMRKKYLKRNERARASKNY